MKGNKADYNVPMEALHALLLERDATLNRLLKEDIDIKKELSELAARVKIIQPKKEGK